MAPVESKRPNNRIFVGKLSLDVDQNALKEQFSKVGEIVNIKVKKNAKKQIAYAFINFANENSPQEALKYHDTQFNGNQIDVQIAKEVKRTPKRNNKNKNNNKNLSGNLIKNNNNGNNNNNDNGNDGRIAGKRPRRAVAKKASHNENKEKELSPTTLFVSNLPFSVDDNDLKDLFKGFSVTSAYTVTRNGRSRGYGFVAFETEEAAKSALEAKNKHQVQDREISVRNAFKYDEPVVQKTNSTDTLYVSNLPYKLADETLQEIFKDYGVAKAYVARTKKGRSKGFGFVVLEGDDLVAKQEKAIAEKNKHKIEEREIYVRAAYNSAESREGGERNNNAESDEPEVKQIALYVSNIPFAITSDELGGLFQDNNGFQSANVVVAKKNGRSRGYGFVTFDTEENRDNALESKKDLKSGDRTLSISIARGKKSNNNNNNNNNRRGPPRRRRFNPRRNGRRNNNNNNNNNDNNDKQ